MLLELYQKLLAKARQSEAQVGLPVGSIIRDSPYDQPHYAEVLDLTGASIGTAEIDRTGDIAGMSPSERCTLNGETTWMPLEQLRNLRTTPFQLVAVSGTNPVIMSASASGTVRPRGGSHRKKTPATA